MTDKKPFKRNKFFNGKLLSADDFVREQNYFLKKSKLINQHVHGSGVAYGLKVIVIDEKTVEIEEGLAIDSQGREIFVPTEISKKTENKFTKDELNCLYIFYKEDDIDQVPTFVVDPDITSECIESNTVENFKLEWGKIPSSKNQIPENGVLLAVVDITNLNKFNVHPEETKKYKKVIVSNLAINEILMLPEVEINELEIKATYFTIMNAVIRFKDEIEPLFEGFDDDTLASSFEYIHNVFTELEESVVKLKGNQTISGVKTFSSLPKVPTDNPTDSTHVASKDYVDKQFEESICKVTLYDQIWYKGASLPIFKIGSTNLSLVGKWHETLSSFIVTPGYEIVIFDDKGFGYGNFSGPTPDLGSYPRNAGGYLRNKIKSIVVFRTG